MAGTGKVTKVRMNSAGVLALLKSSEVQADIAGRADAVQAILPTDRGEEWATQAFVGRDRAQAIVKTANTKAREAAADKGTVLVGALGAGR